LKRLKRLYIENFQSHERTEIQFADGLNVLIGPSDSGKSAILRALRWVLFNQPRGTDYIRIGADKCRVILTMSDGTEIVRERSASVNRYIVRTPDGQERVLEGFGSGVPQEVLNAHNMHPVRLDKDWELSAQFGSQLESPFLLAETGSIRAKSIGRISGAHIMDIALRDTMRDRQSLASEIKHVEQEATRLTEALKPYEDLPRLGRELEESEALYQTAVQKEERLSHLKALLQKWQNCREQIAAQRSILQRLRQLPEAEAKISFLQAEGQRLVLLRRRLEEYRKGKREQRACRRTLTMTEKLAEAAEVLDNLEHRRVRLQTLRRLHVLYRTCKNEQARYQQRLRLTDGVDAVSAVISRLDEKRTLHDRMLRLKPRLHRIRQDRERMVRTLERTSTLAEAVRAVTAAEEAYERWRALAQSAQRLGDCRKRLEDGRKYLKTNAETIEAHTSQMLRLFQQLGRCPTCGSPVDGSVLQHILAEVRGGVSHAAVGRENQRD
jgi:DNA repair exonuclease SbcCD ATPase subunit